MPAHSDHIRRDAEHAARSDMNIEISKVQRRVYAAAKATIADRLAKTESGDLIDGTTLGREAVASALLAYLVDGDVHDPIDGTAQTAIDQAEDPRL